MKLALVFGTLLLFLTAGDVAQSADAARGYDAFRLVRTRNIFDPNRQPIRSDGTRSESRQPQSNYLALTGTMVTPAKSLAFFSGSGANSSKVVAVGESVGSYKIKTISPESVELEKGGQPVTLPVGRQLTLEGTVTVRVTTDAPPPQEAPAEATAPASSAPGTTAAPVPSGDKNDVLRRMMERRAKELSK
jgi:hypothetical protein